MESHELNIFLRKAEEYLTLGFESEKTKEYGNARMYYLMAAQTLGEAAKRSPTNLKITRLERSQSILKHAEMLPKAVKEEGKKDTVFQVLEKPKVTFKDVAGLNEVKEKIKELIITPFSYPDLAKKWKIKTGGGVLVFGPPGTGKTLLAKAVAGELDADFFYVKASDIMSKWVGESEKTIAELFKKARASRKAVIFIDEIDALIPNRTGQSSTVMARVVPQFLAEMDGVDTKNDNILFMAATNIPWMLDPAVLRPGRFDFKCYIPQPDFDARKRIFEINLDVPKEDNFDFDTLAKVTENYSGADIRLICEEAKREMFRKEIEGGKSLLGVDLVLQIQKRIRPSVDDKLLKKYEEFITKR